MRIFPLGDNAITIEFGNEVSLELNEKALALAQHFDANPFPGYIESVPAYSSTTVFFDIRQVREAFPDYRSAFEAVSAVSHEASAILEETVPRPANTIEIPFQVNADVSLDLGDLSAWSGMSKNEVIEIFLGRTYNVFMIGFLPGFAYMGEVDERIAMPRKRTPRTKVPPGSVAIGGKQTGIYPLESPGGWYIIGRTKTKMFDPEDEHLCPLRPGDQVRFVRS
jgi:inhibitor of KinA